MTRHHSPRARTLAALGLLAAAAAVIAALGVRLAPPASADTMIAASAAVLALGLLLALIAVRPALSSAGRLPGLEAAAWTATRSATHQALLRRVAVDAFVALGGRSQGLLREQMAALADLERRGLAADPASLMRVLDAETLAHRLRRMSETALVLAGGGTGRVAADRVAVRDVVNAGVAQVPGWQRVVIDDLPAAAVAGMAAIDLAHVVAELVDNALQFSAPDAPVTVSGRLVGGAYRLVVADRGAGMAGSALAAANGRLAAGRGLVDAGSGELGLAAVGLLARRHSLRVRLDAAEGGGLAAQMEVPRGLLRVPAGVPGRVDARVPAQVVSGTARLGAD